MHPAELATCAMRREWTFGAEDKARQLINYEDGMEYPSVSTECRVIDTDTRVVIIDKSLAEAVRKGEKISTSELMRYSVQIWANKIDKLALQPVTHRSRSSDSGMYVWQYEYDPDFLGYMAGVLNQEDFVSSGGAII
jgi:CRISPR-associated endonuclease/helicase Cas3